MKPINLTITVEEDAKRIEAGEKTACIMMGNAEFEEGRELFLVDDEGSFLIMTAIDISWNGKMKNVPGELLDRILFSSIAAAVGYLRTLGGLWSTFCEESDVTVFGWKEEVAT